MEITFSGKNDSGFENRGKSVQALPKWKSSKGTAGDKKGYFLDPSGE
jgi:hypothetical protein